MRRLRTIPPAGTAIPAGVLLRGVLGFLRPADSRERLARAFKDGFGVREVHLLNSGRAVLTVLLEAMRETRPDRTEVILPGYTCYSVAAAAARAGLKILPVDICLETLDYDHATLAGVDTSRTLALITSNLFGTPNDLPRLEAFCRARGIYMIDDAAQAMYARVGERWAGTYGDAGLFSFDKGKNITTVQGGVLLLQNPNLSEPVGRVVERLPEPAASAAPGLLLKLILYWMLLRPWLYWIPHRLLKLGGTPWEVEYPVTLYPSRLSHMARGQLEILQEITEQRIAQAQLMTDVLPTAARVSARKKPGTAVALRLPFRVSSSRDKSRLLEMGKRFGVSGMYPAAIGDVPEAALHLASSAEDTPHARCLAKTIVTLPTHSYVGPVDHAVLRYLLEDMEIEVVGSW